MIFTPTCSGLYRLMGSAKSIDEALITDDVKAIQAKTKAKRADDEQLLLDDLLSQTTKARGLREPPRGADGQTSAQG